jgi:hypothetical protein
MKPNLFTNLLLAAVTITNSACSTYVTPGPAADFQGLMSSDKKGSSSAPLHLDASAKPALSFPAALLMARLQGQGYRNRDTNSYDFGSFSLVTSRDVEKAEDIQKLARLPGLSSAGTISPLLLSSRVNGESELLGAAARLHADLLLVYTISTTHRKETRAPLLAFLTLGFAPLEKCRVHSTISALLIDAKTSFIYGSIEESAEKDGYASAWGAGSTLENLRRKAEQEAFSKLTTSAGPFWAGVYAKYRHY